MIDDAEACPNDRNFVIPPATYTFATVRAALQTALRRRKLELRAESVAWARVEGVLARGDRRLARVLARMAKNSLAAWARAMREEGLDARAYLRGRRALESALPWAAVSTGVRATALARLGRAAGEPSA